MNIKQVRAVFGAFFAALLLLTGATSALAAPVTTAAVQQQASVLPSAVAPTSTKSCNTFNSGSLWFKNDTMQVTRWWNGSSYTYSISHSSNRTSRQETGSTVHNWQHTAKSIIVYWSSSSYTTYNSPSTSFSKISSSPSVDFRLIEDLLADGAYPSTGVCDIYF